MKKSRKLSTCNQLDLETVGSQPILGSNLPEHWEELCHYIFKCYTTEFSKSPRKVLKNDRATKSSVDTASDDVSVTLALQYFQVFL